MSRTTSRKGWGRIPPAARCVLTWRQAKADSAVVLYQIGLTQGHKAVFSRPDSVATPGISGHHYEKLECALEHVPTWL